MSTKKRPGFSRREQQIMDALFELGEAPVAEIQKRLPDAPSETACRTMLGLLVERGHVSAKRDGRRNLFRAKAPRDRAGRSALRKVVDVFFGGSLEAALAAHLKDPALELSDEEARRLARLIRDAKRDKP
ncbi:MAG: BlaI/MecI/CopY family transcriptional regulator [Planctomycetota bacterium]